MRDRSTPLTEANIAGLAWEKMGGLIPAVVHDRGTGRLLMLGYMNRDALAATLETGFATFFSRSKARLWKKGETSSNVLRVAAIYEDCDGDALLVQAEAAGPVCHLGEQSCFMDEQRGPGWLSKLSNIVEARAKSSDASSYTVRLLEEGVGRIAQKVGEEGVEVALAAVTRDKDGCAEEVADLLYHVTVLMQARGFGWEDVVQVLQRRHAG